MINMLQKYKIIYERRVAKDLSKIPHPDMMRIFEKIETLASWESHSLDIKKLKWYTDNIYRMRVWDYRIIFEYQNDILVILVLQIEHRKSVYM